MNKEQFLSKLKEPTLTEQAKIEIFNWYIQNEAPERIATFHNIPEEFKLSEQTVTGVKGPQGLALLDYSISHIKRILNEKQD